MGEIPGFAFTYQMAEGIVFSLLHLYEKVLPKLNAEGVPPEEAMWLLVENLFLPTVYLELWRKWQGGLEFEFRGCPAHIADRHRREAFKPNSSGFGILAQGGWFPQWLFRV